MASTETSTTSWPFAFLRHGLWAYDAEIESASWYIVFARDVPEGERAALAGGAPPPARGPFYWAGGRVLLLQSPADRYFDSYVWRTYGPDPKENPLEEVEHDLTDEDLVTYGDESELTEDEAQAFVDALDAWLARVHAQRPIALVIGWSGSDTDTWSMWSAAQIPDLVLPLLRDLSTHVRAPSDDTRQPLGPEALFARVTWATLSSYLERHDASALDPSQRDAMLAVLERVRGHDDRLDERIARLSSRLRTPATPG